MVRTEAPQEREICQLRALGGIFALLSYLQDEPLCGRCSAFARVFEKAMEKFLLIEKALGRDKMVPKEARCLFSHIYGVLSDVKIPDSPVRQKKEGNCGFPPGVCMAKNALAIYERVDEQT